MSETLATDPQTDLPYGTCHLCGRECGDKSTICIACTLNPKRREKARKGKLDG